MWGLRPEASFVFSFFQVLLVLVAHKLLVSPLALHPPWTILSSKVSPRPSVCTYSWHNWVLMSSLHVPAWPVMSPAVVSACPLHQQCRFPKCWTVPGPSAHTWSLGELQLPPLKASRHSFLYSALFLKFWAPNNLFKYNTSHRGNLLEAGDCPWCLL